MLNQLQKVIVGILTFIFSTEVMAYIDPGTGSLILQSIIAGVAAGLYTIKLYWYKIKSLFTGNKEELDVDIDIDEDNQT